MKTNQLSMEDKQANFMLRKGGNWKKVQYKPGNTSQCVGEWEFKDCEVVSKLLYSL